MDRDVKFGVILSGEWVQKFLSVKLNLQHPILLNTFWRNKLGKVTSGEVHHVRRLLIDVSKETDLISI